MPIRLHHASKYVLVIVVGLITEAQIIQMISEMISSLDRRSLYVVMDITEMIYQPEVILTDNVITGRLSFISHTNLKGIVYILATNHPLREIFANTYDQLGYGHKLHFAVTVESAHSLFDS